MNRSIPNIGPRGQRQRLRLGVFALAAAILLAALFLSLDVQRGWRLAVFPLLWISALGFFQARDKT